MSDTLREHMLASATDAVNALCTFAQDQPLADFDAREGRVFKVGRELLATWLGQVARAILHVRCALLNHDLLKQAA